MNAIRRPAPADDALIQKTWTAEGTAEYRGFKSITNENAFLADYIARNVALLPGRILDVGGREGDITSCLAQGSRIDIVDPDPTLDRERIPATLHRARIQDFPLRPDMYAMVVCSHVLGYLSAVNQQEQVLDKVLGASRRGASCILFYNRNVGYMKTLLDFSRSAVSGGHHDFFDEALLRRLDPRDHDVSTHDVTFRVSYPTFELLARCCWFLFGDRRNTIDATAALFLPKLRNELAEPAFDLEERVVVIRRQ